MGQCVHGSGSQKSKGDKYSFGSWMRASSPVKSKPGRNRRESEENLSRSIPSVQKPHEKLAVVTSQDLPMSRILRDTVQAVSNTEARTCGEKAGDHGRVTGSSLSADERRVIEAEVETFTHSVKGVGEEEGTLHENPSCMGVESIRDEGLHENVPCMIFSSTRKGSQLAHSTQIIAPREVEKPVVAATLSYSVVLGGEKGFNARKINAKGQRWKRRARERVDGDTGMAREEMGVKRQGEALMEIEVILDSSQETSRNCFGTVINSMAEEELVDQKKYLEDACKPKCVKPLIEYEACVKRVEGDDTGSKHCTGQYFDYFSCIDKCVAPKLFAKLK
ncbi:hypothetical protein ACOSQ3_009762 [Xanthoceras sorbifolium]